MSGIEVAGLVLATLPIVTEVVKTYASGVTTIRDVVLPQHRDEKLEELYEDLWIEMHLLSQQLRVILDALPVITNQRKSQLEKGLDLNDFAAGSPTLLSFRAFFKCEDDYVAFGQLLDRIARLLCRLVENKYFNVRSDQMSSGQLLLKLQAFVNSRDKRRTTSTLKERLNLRMKEKDLQLRVTKLEKWNQRLRVLIAHNEQLNGASSSARAPKTTHERPSIALARMPQILYKALMRYYGRRCGEQHSAMFGLHMSHRIHQAVDPAELDFDLFLSLPRTITSAQWQESRVHVRPQEVTKVKVTTSSQHEVYSERQKLTEVCQEVQSVFKKGHCLCLLAEEDGAQYNMWRLRSMKRQLCFLNTVESASLATCLTSFARLSLSQKRALALLLAYALVLLDGSPWLDEWWTKNHISFFKTNTDTKSEFDFTRPYILSSIKECISDVKGTNLDVFHPNPSILSLGILLIEIETGYPIEKFRLPEDLSDGIENDNTDFSVADRVSKSLSRCTPDYQEAIFACLNIPWRVAGKKVTLEDPYTRNAVYETIISRLESEVESLGIDLTT